ncbi:MAG: FAD-dependent oxidoreductase [Planctomycetes bacterium]|nr:FAD-dependent oxidoreductase [Planctomycetota bacterium]
MNEHNRRKFLGTLAGGVVATGSIGKRAYAVERRSDSSAPSEELDTGGKTGAAGQPTSLAAHPMSVDRERLRVEEAPRRTPVAADVDVLVVGGGPTGVGAALAAAREGARTLLVERHGMLGGVWTAGLLNPFFDFKRKGWLVEELVRRLQEAGAWQTWKWSATFDTEAMKLLLETMMAEAGVTTWYYSFMADTIVEGNQVRGVIVQSKSGREAVLAKVVVDCSGEGDVAARAGAPYRLGRMDDGLCQPMTLMFEIEGAAHYAMDKSTELYDQLAEAIDRKELDVELPFGRVNYAPWIIHVPRSDTAVVQATHVYRMNGTNVRDLTRATIEARRQAHELVSVMKHIKGLEDVRITQTAPAVGVRETRRICGRHTLDLEDLRAGRRFDDAVTFGAFGVDIHNVNPGEERKSAHHTPIRPYEIPYGCLLPESPVGLLVAGRSISGTHEAHASYRVTGTCMATGQAAGLAAAMAAAESKGPHELDGRALKRALADRGVGFL